MSRHAAAPIHPAVEPFRVIAVKDAGRWPGPHGERGSNLNVRDGKDERMCEIDVSGGECKECLSEMGPAWSVVSFLRVCMCGRVSCESRTGPILACASV